MKCELLISPQSSSSCGLAQPGKWQLHATIIQVVMLTLILHSSLPYPKSNQSSPPPSLFQHHCLPCNSGDFLSLSPPQGILLAIPIFQSTLHAPVPMQSPCQPSWSLFKCHQIESLPSLPWRKSTLRITLFPLPLLLHLPSCPMSPLAACRYLHRPCRPLRM